MSRSPAGAALAVVLSKALMLARDIQITDPTIIQQLRC
ncbi:DUF7737 domain-containing protein [Plantactinospora sonchi]